MNHPVNKVKMFEELENSKVKWSSKDEEEVQSAEQEGTSSTGTSIFEIESNSEVLMSYKGMYNRLALTNDLILTSICLILPSEMKSVRSWLQSKFHGI